MTLYDLSDKYFGSRLRDLSHMLSAPPRGTTSVDLSRNILICQSGRTLAQALNAISVEITSLNLSANHLGNKIGGRTSSKKLAQSLSAIPTSVTSLNLSRNNLHYLSGAELADVFRAIPGGVTSLNVSDNDFQCLSGVELAEAFKALPATVTSLNIADPYPNIHHMHDRDGYVMFPPLSLMAWAIALSSVPNTVLKINISYHDIFSNQTTKTQNRLQCLLVTKFSYCTVDVKEAMFGQGVESSPPDVFDNTRITISDEESMHSRNWHQNRDRFQLSIQSRQVTLESELYAWLESIKTDTKKQDLLLKVEALSLHLKVLARAGTSQSTLDLLRFLTLEFIDGPITHQEYKGFAKTLEGAPSTTMKCLGALMLAVAAAAIVLLVTCPPILVTAGSLMMYGGVTGSVAAIASAGFFAKGYRSQGLHRLVTDIAAEKKIADDVAPLTLQPAISIQ